MNVSLQDCVPQNVVVAADSQTFSEEGELCLRVLEELNTFVHHSDDVCLSQELIRDILSRSNSGSKGDPFIGDCGGLGHFLHIVDFPLGR